MSDKLQVHYLIEDKFHIRCVLAEQVETKSFVLIFIAKDNKPDASLLARRVPKLEALEHFEYGMQKVLPPGYKYEYKRTDIDKMMTLQEIDKFLDVDWEKING